MAVTTGRRPRPPGRPPKPIAAVPISAQIADRVRADIRRGRYRDGEALPSTREMADWWGVSVFTVTQAMKVLAAEGLVEAQDRSKRVVRLPAPRRPARQRTPLPAARTEVLIEVTAGAEAGVELAEHTRRWGESIRTDVPDEERETQRLALTELAGSALAYALVLTTQPELGLRWVFTKWIWL